MKFASKKLILLGVMLSFLLSISLAANEVIVVLDPGHGGHDPGAVVSGVEEADLNLDIALKTAALLKEEGITVYMSRDTDVFVPLREIPKVGINHNADLFISIHNNWLNSTSTKGSMVLYSNTRDSGNKIRNKQIAQIIQDNLVEDLGMGNIGISLRNNLAVLNGIGSIPATLIEVGCMTNPGDLASLNNPEFRQKAAQVISDSIIEVLGKLEIKGFSGSTRINKCTECGGKIDSKYYETQDGTHYRICTNNKDHQFDIEEHKFKDGKCTLCDAIKCIKCDGAIVDVYKATDDGKHYSICSKDESHQYNIEEHKFKDGKCTVCGIEEKKEEATPEPKVETYTLFKDLPDSHWAYQEVKAMKDAGIVVGDTAGNLGPDEKVTAEQFLTLLSQLTSKKGLAKSDGTSYIPNNMEKNWFYDLYVNLTKVLGNGNDKSKKLGEEEIKLILGNTDAEVVASLKKPITRERVANIMGKFVADSSQTSTNVLNSNDWEQVDSIYKKRMNELAERNIFRGVLNPDGTISVNPKVEITKVEAIALISRMYSILY